MTTTRLSAIDEQIQVQAMTGQIMTTLLREGYAPEKAYRIARSQAEACNSQQPGMVAGYHVIPHPLGWVVRQATSATPCLLFTSRDEAAAFGQVLAQKYAATLVVHQANGHVQRRMAYA